ncbi:MAG: fatty acyl-AMP ligase [Gemmatimonadetes bacterium]|nr:fatty acyl-AMP ligase [Gemmatimonadota bacterium]
MGGSETPVAANLVDLLRQKAQADPDRVQYRFLADSGRESDSLTLSQLDARARTIAVQLQSRCSPGDRVLLLYPSGLDFVSAFFGCLYAGAVAVPAYPPRNQQHMDRIETIVHDAGAALILTTESTRDRIETWITDGQSSDLQVLATDVMSAEEADVMLGVWRAPNILGDDLAFLQYTSGSTAEPKGVMVTHDNIMHNERSIQQTLGMTESSIIVSWLPVFHDMGLIGCLLQVLFCGSLCVLMAPTAFLKRPMRWLQAAADYQAELIVAPNFAYDLCVDAVSEAQRVDLDLSCLRIVGNGAEPVLHDTLERFCSTFAECGLSASAITPMYGLAEATLMVSGATGGTTEVADIDMPGADPRRVVSCGHVATGVEVAIVDAVTQCRVGTGGIGEIWVRGRSVAAGYWGQTEATQEIFAARIRHEDSGPWLRTGDLGLLRDGDLYVTGRIKDLIVVRGANHYPQDIEQTVGASHDVLPLHSGAAFTITEQGTEKLVVVHEIRRRFVGEFDLDTVVRAARRAVSRTHGLELAALVLLRPGRLPKTSSGKVRRRQCREEYHAGTLRSVAQWSTAGTQWSTAETQWSTADTQCGSTTETPELVERAA